MNHSQLPILVIDQHVKAHHEDRGEIHPIITELEKWGFSILRAESASEGLQLFNQRTEISCILFDWQLEDLAPNEFIEAVRKKNHLIPLFIMTEKTKLKDISVDLLEVIDGYVWKLEDTPHFIAGRIDQAIELYVQELMPPFFKELFRYVEEYKYSWHTPGHSGGLAFLKSPVGHLFHNFFGENVFRSDLSVSVPELGSLMEHSGVNGEAERNAARIFGAEQTYFVTNGTSTANKIVANACIKAGDIVLVDRNCHKSLQHALTLTGAIPVYFIPSRNAYGIIGGIHLDQFTTQSIREKIKNHPLIENKNARVSYAVVTNSTYDGLIYDVLRIKEAVKEEVQHLHFDEAWYAYAKFHPIYKGRFGMDEEQDPKHPAVYATQSTHKLLAAFSQASMIHIRSGNYQVDPSTFNEAFMMHTSTSPQYGIIASLDVAAKMMEGVMGKTLIQDAIDEAISFRKKMEEIREEIERKKGPKEKRWWFGVWQPKLKKDQQESWLLKSKDRWHGYEIEDRFMMLDPIKVTLLTPGMNDNGGYDDWGIPAPIVARFLMKKGIVDEKTGFNTFLVLFSLGITKGKASILMSALFDFKKAYDENASLEELFPDLLEEFPEQYGSKGLKELCDAMHNYLKEANIAKLTEEVFSKLPSPQMTPHGAYQELLKGNVEEVTIHELMHRTLAVMLVPYPPGIPVIMPGEKVSEKESALIDYLKTLEEFDALFPGFETETHGIEVREGRYYTKVLKAFS